ncbi:hypothetical protein [Methylobacterium sp.]|uniref:hypothetical protein n=1 Tax=Methylobacterium sp. TaxID=409 RepID=UPI000C68E71C|nr:hypothetical protein [Methylobacterium sp.]MBP30455.1 hypothetical protein [Methylobacterium sp.]
MAAGSNVERLKLPTAEEALIYKRTTATDNTYSVIRDGGQSLKMLPHCLLRAFECEAWKERRTPNGATVENRDFLDWVTATYPKGLGATPEVVEAILTSSRDVAEAQQARLLWDRAVRRDDGRPVCDETVDNVHSLERPAGNSAAAGMRKLDKAAESGNSIAAQALQAVMEGRQSVHGACVEAGLRKSTKVDPDVRDRAAAQIADILLSNLGDDAVMTVRANLSATTTKAIAIAIANLAGECIMDRRRG